jgi:hypothetical protein
MNALSIPQQPQSQAPLDEQLLELRIAANRLGLYDGADFLTKVLEEYKNPPCQKSPSTTKPTR